MKVGACISLYLGINQVIVYFDIAIPIRLDPAIIIPEIITLDVPDCVVVHLIVVGSLCVQHNACAGVTGAIDVVNDIMMDEKIG